MPLGGESPTALLYESIGGGNHVEGSYDEGEIMVEIVGSDVFVNGVGSHNGDLDGREFNQKASESIYVWNEGDVLDEEVWNPEISVENVAKCEPVEFVKSEPFDCRLGTFVEGIVQISEREDVLADRTRLEEVSRRIELGLTCSCIPKDAYMCEESRHNSCTNQSSRAALFEPDTLLDYVTNLATSASSSADLLHLEIAKAQLFAFYRSKGYCSTSGLNSSTESMNNEQDKQRCTPMDDSELMRNRAHEFIWGYRNPSTSNKEDRKRKASEVFEFDDTNDSYWKDRIVHNHNHSGEQPRLDLQNGAANPQPVQFTAAKLVKLGHSRKRSDADKNVKRLRQGSSSSPAELILNFVERRNVPSKISLNKMFRRFGPLMESETIADPISGFAKVIFKRGCDADVAVDSAEKFKIFGKDVVKYEIGYSPVISVKISSGAMPR